jgi:hypothetical protein
MGQNIRLNWGVSRVGAYALDLLEDEERRCLDLSILQVSVLRQMVFPWAKMPSRLVEDYGDYQVTVDMPTAYLEALEELEELLSGAYDGPETGCAMGEVYVDRGDLPGWDFEEATLTRDYAFHDMDLTNVIGDTSATRVKIRVIFHGTAVGSGCAFREAGNVADVNAGGSRLQVANVYTEFECDVKMSVAQHIEYSFSSTVDDIYMVIRGYWIPAV